MRKVIRTIHIVRESMKKRWVILLSMGVLIGLTGCGKAASYNIVSDLEESMTTEEETLPNCVDNETQKDVYDTVLAEYEDMVKNQGSGDIDAYNASFWVYIGTEIRAHEMNVFYAQYDIDGNGREELIIAGRSKDSIEIGTPPRYYDLYTFDGTNVIHVFPNMEFGYRTNFALLENGVIKVQLIYSATESVIDFYRISGDGMTPEQIDSFSMVGDMNSETVTLQYFQRKDEISEQEYQTKISSYGEEITTSLEWTQINSL